MLDSYDGLKELGIYCGILAGMIFIYLIFNGSNK
jgi:hypothetical protein